MKRRTIIRAATAVLIGGLFALAVYETAWSDGHCTTCHSQAEFVAASQATAHASVECLDCHTSGNGLGRMAYATAHLPRLVPFADRPTRDLAAVSNARCEACHESIFTEPVEANGIRIDHALCTSTAECTQCHSTTAHSTAVTWVRTYDMETCLECHVSDGPANCDKCHEGRPPEDRITTGVFAVTHGENWRETHGMGNSATCSACHTAADCSSCHGPGLPHGEDFIEEHAGYSREPGAQCFDCHETSFCEGCHGLAMPHPRSFVREHSGPAKEDRELCARCHLDSDCIVCHETHVHPGGAVGTLPGGGASQ